MSKRQLGANNSTVVAILRDVERDADAYAKAGDTHKAAKLRAQAAEIRKEITSYRHAGTVKRMTKTGKIKSYKNLGVFNAECSKNGSSFASKAMICELTNIRCLADGSGLATVRVQTPTSQHWKVAHPRDGVWRLGFASCAVMKEHLKGRVDPAKPNMLDGARKRRR